MNEQIWSLLGKEFARFPQLRGEGASNDEIKNAESLLGKFPDSYIHFLTLYGAAIVGAYRIFGLRQVEAMGRRGWSVIEKTTQFRQKKWPGTEEWIVVSMDHGGNPIGIDREGNIWISEHETGSMHKIAHDFTEFLASCIQG